MLRQEGLDVIGCEAIQGDTMVAQPIAKVENYGGILAPALDVIGSALIMVVDHSSERGKNVVRVFSSKTEV